MSCPGAYSQVNPGRPLLICLNCRRYIWGIEGKGPAVHDGKVWVCINLESV